MDRAEVRTHGKAEGQKRKFEQTEKRKDGMLNSMSL